MFWHLYPDVSCRTQEELFVSSGRIDALERHYARLKLIEIFLASCACSCDAPDIAVYLNLHNTACLRCFRYRKMGPKSLAVHLIFLYREVLVTEGRGQPAVGVSSPHSTPASAAPATRVLPSSEPGQAHVPQNSARHLALSWLVT